jgi:3-oxoacyl-[acyl-carrier-protein] synthase III
MTYISHSFLAQVEEKSAAMSMAITRALADAGITSKEIDLVCAQRRGPLLTVDLPGASCMRLHLVRSPVLLCHISDKVEEKSAAMSMAITRALADAGITSKEIDLVCGTSNGSEPRATADCGSSRSIMHAPSPGT